MYTSSTATAQNNVHKNWNKSKLDEHDVTLVAFEAHPDLICFQSQVKHKADTMNEKAIDTGSPFAELLAVAVSILRLRNNHILFPDSEGGVHPSCLAKELSNKVISTSSF